MEIIHKQCHKCKWILPLTEFHRSKRHKYGHKNYCKKCSSELCKEHRIKNIEAYKEREKKYRKENKKKIAQRDRKIRKRYMENWIDYFKTKYGNIPYCQICGRKLKWNRESKDLSEIVNFDHRNGGKEKIDMNPATWLRSHPPVPKNIEIWESCNFGILCRECNKLLPTKNRKEWLKKTYKYVFGEKLWK